MLCENEPVGSLPNHVRILILSSLGDYLRVIGFSCRSGRWSLPDAGLEERPGALGGCVCFNGCQSEPLRFQMLPGTSSIV